MGHRKGSQLACSGIGSFNEGLTQPAISFARFGAQSFVGTDFGSGNSGTILSQSKTYDPASNVTSLSTTLAAVPGASGSGGSETQNFCYNEQNRLVWAGNSGTQPGEGNGTCGSSTLSNTLTVAGHNDICL